MNNSGGDIIILIGIILFFLGVIIFLIKELIWVQETEKVVENNLTVVKVLGENKTEHLHTPLLGCIEIYSSDILAGKVKAIFFMGMTRLVIPKEFYDKYTKDSEGLQQWLDSLTREERLIIP